MLSMIITNIKNIILLYGKAKFFATSLQTYLLGSMQLLATSVGGLNCSFTNSQITKLSTRDRRLFQDIAQSICMLQVPFQRWFLIME